MARKEREYCLVVDDDGHWFVCPVDKADQAEAYFEAVMDYWDGGNREGEGPPPAEPLYLVPVSGNPSRVHFREYRIT